MGRKRNTDKDLPQRVYSKHNAFYYVTPDGKWIRLGKTKHEMYLALSRMNLSDTPCYTIKHLWQRYEKEVVPGKSKATQASNKTDAENLLKVFGNMSPESIKSRHVAEYLDTRGSKAPTKANKEIGLLSHMFTKAIRWGIVENNPCRGVERNETKPRERYVEDWELAEFKKACDEFMSCYVDLKYMLGVRKTDMLLMSFAQLKEDGIYVRPSKTRNKTGEARLYEWTPDLRSVIERIRQLPRPTTSTYLFCTRDGQPLIELDDYTTPKFGYRWSKVMKRALRETKLRESFQERDLRAKSGTDADLQGQDATDLLGHGDRRTTQIYIRHKKAKSVKPLGLPTSATDIENDA